MNKNLKKIIAVALTLSALSAAAPASMSNCNLLTTKVYADSSDYRLTDIDVETVSGGNDVSLYEKKNYKNKLDNSSTLESEYYGKVSSGKSKIKIDVEKNESSSQVRIFKGSKHYDEGDEISLSSGENTIYICVYDKDKNKDDMTKSNCEKKYTLRITRGSSSSSDDDDDNSDNVYLKSLSVRDNNDNDLSIDFSKKTRTYNLNVKSSVDEIEIKAKPDADSDDYDDYTVTIDDNSVDEDDNWKRKVDLKKGKNKIVITVEDDDSNKRSYTLNVNRGEVSSTSDSIYLDSLKVGATDLTLSENKKEWNLKFGSDAKRVSIIAEPKSSDYTVTIDGDTVDDTDSYKKLVELEEGEVKTYKVKVKNASGTEQTYTLNLGRGDVDSSKFPQINTAVNNNTNTNTNTNNNATSNVQPQVQMKAGWNKDNATGVWYLCDFNGNKLTGWHQMNGKWYYMDPSTAIMKTGWVQSPASGAWYYLDESGAMVTNTYVGIYRIGPTGEWIQ